jgi:hypothetical protein
MTGLRLGVVADSAAAALGAAPAAETAVVSTPRYVSCENIK